MPSSCKRYCSNKHTHLLDSEFPDAESTQIACPDLAKKSADDFSTHRSGRQEYQHRHCVYCHQKTLGDETHIFLKCPVTANLRSDTATQIDQILRLFDAPPWSSLTDAQRISILLGNPPTSLLKKYTKGWMQECVPLLHTYTTKLRSHLATLLPSPPPEPEDDAHDSDP